MLLGKADPEKLHIQISQVMEHAGHSTDFLLNRHSDSMYRIVLSAVTSDVIFLTSNDNILLT